MSPGSTTTLSAAMISSSVLRSTPRNSWPRWCARSTSTPRPCTPWNAMCSRPRWCAKQRWLPPSPAASGFGPTRSTPGAVAVVVDGLLDAVAVGVELGAGVRERVPLRRVLQRERHLVVGPHVDVTRARRTSGSRSGGRCRRRSGLPSMSSVGARTRRVAPLVQRGAAGIVERQAQAEADAGLDLAHALEHLLGGEQVDAAELVVVAPVAPGRAVRALLPPLRHGCLPRPYRPVAVPTGWYCTDRFGLRSRARRSAHDRQKDFVVSADGHLLEPTDLFRTRLPKHLRDRAVWEEDFEIEPLVEGGARDLPAAAHAGVRGLDGLPRTARPAGACPKATPSSSSRTWTSTASTCR